MNHDYWLLFCDSYSVCKRKDEENEENLTFEICDLCQHCNEHECSKTDLLE